MRCTLIFPASLISIHALREEGDVHQRRFCANQAGISIHALREEGDTAAITTADSSATFLSTPSARRATTNTKECGDTLAISIHALREEGDRDLYRFIADFCVISIHALREEGDILMLILLWITCYFYPRPPRGGRLVMRMIAAWSMLFLSTPSVRRATAVARAANFVATISIHALREEGDSKNRDKISIFKQIVQHSARI